MVREVFSFDDELTGHAITVYVETSIVYDDRKGKKEDRWLYLRMDTDYAYHTTSAYIPRKQAKKTIKAMKEVLND